MRCQTSEMGRLPKQPNHQLQDLLDEVRTSRKGFARRIVERGRTVGVELHYDHTSVGRWLAGEQPNPPGPMLIAEVLTELTGRRITPESSGMASIQDSPGLGLEFPLSLSEATAGRLLYGEAMSNSAGSSSERYTRSPLTPRPRYGG